MLALTIVALALAWLSGCASANAYWYPVGPARLPHRPRGWAVRVQTRRFALCCAALALLLALLAVT